MWRRCGWWLVADRVIASTRVPDNNPLQEQKGRAETILETWDRLTGKDHAGAKNMGQDNGTAREVEEEKGNEQIWQRLFKLLCVGDQYGSALRWEFSWRWKSRKQEREREIGRWKRGESKQESLLLLLQRKDWNWRAHEQAIIHWGLGPLNDATNLWAHSAGGLSCKFRRKLSVHFSWTVGKCPTIPTSSAAKQPQLKSKIWKIPNQKRDTCNPSIHSSNMPSGKHPLKHTAMLPMSDALTESLTKGLPHHLGGNPTVFWTLWEAVKLLLCLSVPLAAGKSAQNNTKRLN